MSTVTKPPGGEEDDGKGLGPDQVSAPVVTGNADGAMQGGAVIETKEVAPLFEIIIPSALYGAKEPLYHIKIYGDGQVEGLEKLVSATRQAQVINRIPLFIDSNFVGPLRAFTDDLQDYVLSIQQGAEILRAGPAPAKERQQ